MVYFKKTISITGAPTCDESYGQDRYNNHINIHGAKSSQCLQNRKQNDSRASKAKILEHLQNFKNREESATQDTWHPLSNLLQLNSNFGM